MTGDTTVRGNGAALLAGLRRLRPWGLAALTLVSSAGCGHRDGLGRRAIRGDVTLDGRPLDKGSISFEPAPGDPAPTAVGATVLRGRFSVPREQGPVPGSYTVRIYASSGEQEAPDPGRPAGGSRPMIERIPARYNLATTLRAEITSDGPDEFRFALLSDPRPALGSGDSRGPNPAAKR